MKIPFVVVEFSAEADSGLIRFGSGLILIWFWYDPGLTLISIFVHLIPINFS